jgi:hypothetical protein
MVDYAELEIGFNRRESSAYAVEFRFSQPGSEVDVQPIEGQVGLDLQNIQFMPGEEAAEYGRRLTDMVFLDPDVRSAFLQARSSAHAQELPLRLRLVIGPNAPELHNVHWETLLDPQNNNPLSTTENLLFSRYLGSADWRPVRLRPHRDLQALLVIANPANLASYQLAPVDVAGELARAKAGLGSLRVSVLGEPGDGQPATLNNIVARLRESEYDILYIVAHGTFARGEPFLWLVGEDGNVSHASADQLATYLQELANRPRLVVLASCESAGSGSGDALLALGPSLAEAGIPAVLAMQGQISMPTVAQFMPIFFQELQRDGQVDRALAAARGSVRTRYDSWMPVLFMRLKSGRIWYTPGFGEAQDEFDKWQSLAGSIQDKVCTPILGPGLLDAILGPRRDMAVEWAQEHAFPLSPQDREVLPRVAQYIFTNQAPDHLPRILRQSIRDRIIDLYRPGLTESLQQAEKWSSPQVIEAIQVAAAAHSSRSSFDPYAVMAQLRLPVYITAAVDDLLTVALQNAGAMPQVRILPWTKLIPKERAIYEDMPTPERPLVYHLFGHLSISNSMVLSEDQYFDYLLNVALNKDLIPSAVRAALNSSSLLFLGFQMDDWEFRVFFRFLMAQEGKDMLKYYSHAAAQIEPEEDRTADIKRARRYLEQYFQKENINVYWGSTEEFLNDLQQHL